MAKNAYFSDDYTDEQITDFYKNPCNHVSDSHYQADILKHEAIKELVKRGLMSKEDAIKAVKCMNQGLENMQFDFKQFEL